MSGGNFFGGPIGAPGQPGALSGFDTGAASQAMGLSLTEMANRYNQLGLGGSTAEAMDLGQAPSISGGIPAQFAALQGQMQNNALQTLPQGSGGKGGSPASAIGLGGSLLGALK